MDKPPLLRRLTSSWTLGCELPTEGISANQRYHKLHLCTMGTELGLGAQRGALPRAWVT